MTIEPRAMPPRQVLNRALFRGARIERQTSRLVILCHGTRRTTVPMYGQIVPRRTVERIQRDLGIDLMRPRVVSVRRELIL